MSSTSKSHPKGVYIDLAEKHHVSLTYFKGKPYFHIRHNSAGKHISLTYADMKSLVDQFPMMVKKLKEMKKKIQDEETKKKQKLKHKKTSDDVEDDDEIDIAVDSSSDSSDL